MTDLQRWSELHDKTKDHGLCACRDCLDRIALGERILKGEKGK
jgi:hypothetical protein